MHSDKSTPNGVLSFDRRAYSSLDRNSATNLKRASSWAVDTRLWSAFAACGSAGASPSALTVQIHAKTGLTVGGSSKSSLWVPRSSPVVSTVVSGGTGVVFNSSSSSSSTSKRPAVGIVIGPLGSWRLANDSVEETRTART